MKRIASIILVLCLLGIVPVFAADNPTVTVGTVVAAPEETVNVTVDLANCAGFCNIAIEVGYDTNVMTLTNATSHVPGASFTTAQNITANPYNMQWDSANDTVYTGTLATLTFTVKDGAEDGFYPITVDYYKGRNGDNIDGDDVNYNAAYEPLNLTYQNGGITVHNQPYMEIVDADLQNLTFNISLSAIPYNSTVLVGLFDDSGAMVSFKRCPAAKNVTVSLDKSIQGSCVKIMWWESSILYPLCPAQIIPLN